VGQEELAKVDRLKQLIDEQLIAQHFLGSTPGIQRHEAEREMWRRQMQESRELRTTMAAFKRSADRSGTWMIRLTIVIAGLTLALVALTVALLVAR
jgi:hypothetical protein